MTEQPPKPEASDKPIEHPGIITVPYHQDLLDYLAREIIQLHADRLPDLSQVHILVPHNQLSARLRRLLLKYAEDKGFNALLGPDISLFSSWINRLPNHELMVLSEHQRELMLVEALVRHPYLYGEGNPWMLADCLLELFDELNEIHFQPSNDFDAFLTQLGSAYGLSSTENHSLVGEARLVHTLWLAWHQQMQESGVVDRHTDQLLKLTASKAAITEDQAFYLAGYNHLTAFQLEWLRDLLSRQQGRIYLQGEAPPEQPIGYHAGQGTLQILAELDAETTLPAAEDDYSRLIAHAFDSGSADLRERAGQAQQQFPDSPLSSRLSVFEAASAEQEAQAIDLQIRLWWLEGKRNMGIVTENRRLARRVRALLERAGIELQDAAGWALSTTSAAATLERWLECVEEDFPHQPLLDLLKSPFLQTGQDRDSLLNTVYLFEQGIVLRENIPHGLERYRRHTRYRQNRLPPELAAGYDDIHSLLELLTRAVSPLQKFLKGKRHKPDTILTALQESLDTLGLTKTLQEDAAGERVLEELQQMQAATRGSSLHMPWSEFRTWLGRTLERFNFQPPGQSGQVQLMSLAQSTLCRFDAVIIAGAEREYLPGAIGNSPFFNDGVRQALGLASRSEQLAGRFHQFRQLLCAAPKILVSRRTEQDGEDVIPSPWLEQLQSFHEICYGHDLVDKTLALMIGNPDTQVTNKSTILPEPVAPNPGVSLDATLLPDKLSASGYQQLMDCPYQFFASRCLKLSPPESIREMLEKSDYGERVHRCLEAFHSDVHELPGPFAEPFIEANRQQAIDSLREIAAAVFAEDLEDNFLHRGWLKRWYDVIPYYVDWQLTRARDHQLAETERTLETPLVSSGLTLKGRLDRIDHYADGLAIIDYKTGHVPSDVSDSVHEGESVQLPFYAFLAEQALKQPIRSVEYLPLANKTLKARGEMDSEDLRSLSAEIISRLEQIILEVSAGQAMPAWGDEQACSHCHMDGICRREVWEENR